MYAFYSTQLLLTPKHSLSSFRIVMLEIEGINSIWKSVSVSFGVCVVRASRRARRSGVGAYGASASNAGGPVANILAGPVGRGAALLRRHKGFKLFWSKVNYMQGFYAVALFWMRRCKGFKGIQLQKP